VVTIAGGIILAVVILFVFMSALSFAAEAESGCAIRAVIALFICFLLYACT